jgi:hypothetical protein
MDRNRLLLLALLWASSAFAAEPRVVATFESLGIYWSPPEKPDAAGCAIQFRKAGESTWREGLPLWYDPRNRECRGSLVQLEPATKYKMRVGGREFSARTWNERFPDRAHRAGDKHERAAHYGGRHAGRICSL